ncbi:hypothetical protein RB595_007011 [Gaeumannomyces hyphopodioides]
MRGLTMLIIVRRPLALEGIRVLVEYWFENFESTLEAARDTRLELGLLQMLVADAAIVAQGLERERAAGPRLLLRRLPRRPGRTRLARRSFRGSGVDVSAELPVAAIAAAAACAPLPLPGSLTISVRVGATSAEILAYTAPGERVYFMLCRRVRFSWFSTRSSVDRAYPEKGIRWKSIIGSRGDGDEDGGGFEAQMAGMPEPDELDGALNSVEIGGEQIFFTDRNDTDESNKYWSS